jgi:hypothetical protein
MRAAWRQRGMWAALALGLIGRLGAAPSGAPDVARVQASVRVASQAPVRQPVADLTEADRELLRVCDRALGQRAFDEATAAGLSPSAAPIDIDRERTGLEGRRSNRLFSGMGTYRPDPGTGDLAVSFECLIEIGARTVSSVTYAVLDDRRQPRSVPPAQVAHDLLALDACRRRIESRMNDEVGREGDRSNASELQVSLDDVTATRGRGTIEFRGNGRGRYGPAYDWQETFVSCRFDQGRKEATRSSHAVKGGLTIRQLAEQPGGALGGCRRLIEAQVRDNAVRRGFTLWDLGRFRLEYEEVGTVTPRGAEYDVTGRAQYRLDPRHQQPTHLTYSCTLDATNRLTGRYTLQDRGRTPSGAVSTGVTEVLRCAYYTGPPQRCEASVGGDVRLLQQLPGGTECVEFKTWTWSPTGFVVWGDCRAEFEFRVR